MKNAIYFVALLPILLLFTACPQDEEPMFLSVEPEFGSEGQLIVLKGENIGEIRELLFNGKPIPFNTAYNSDVALLFRIPMETPLGPTTVTVRTDGGSFEFPFLVSELPPIIKTFSPRNGSPGDTICVFGENFFDPPLMVWFRTGEMPMDETVRQDSVASEPFFVNETKDTMKVVVPEGAGTGPLVVEANGGVAEVNVNYFAFRRVLITDFDGNGARGDNSALRTQGFFEQMGIDQHIQSSNPTPIDGNFLKMSGRPTNSSGIIGLIETSSAQSDTFDISAPLNRSFIEMDVNSSGVAGGILRVSFRELAGDANPEGRTRPFTNDIRLPETRGWKTIRLPLVQFTQTNGGPVNPGFINRIQFVLVGDTGPNGTERNRAQVAIDNVNFVESI